MAVVSAYKASGVSFVPWQKKRTDTIYRLPKRSGEKTGTAPATAAVSRQGR
jgi:hypothetical protein